MKKSLLEKYFDTAWQLLRPDERFKLICYIKQERHMKVERALRAELERQQSIDEISGKIMNWLDLTGTGGS